MFLNEYFLKNRMIQESYDALGRIVDKSFMEISDTVRDDYLSELAQLDIWLRAFYLRRVISKIYEYGWSLNPDLSFDESVYRGELRYHILCDMLQEGLTNLREIPRKIREKTFVATYEHMDPN